jgi:prolipoprotein diacylglyceryl transferase
LHAKSKKKKTVKRQILFIWINYDSNLTGLVINLNQKYAMTTLAAINWSVDPEIISFGGLSLRWYGLLFALGFLLGQMIMTKIFRLERRPMIDIETLTIYMVVFTIVGARLGHCLFYQPDYYLERPLEILKVWEGGLASHGAALSILLGLWLYCNSVWILSFRPPYHSFRWQKRENQSYLWLLDRMVIVVALGGGLIRLGNLMNSEIIGKPTNSDWGFIFLNNPEAGFMPRHPAQLYEAIACFVLFAILYLSYMAQKGRLREGLFLGIFLVWVFGLRFLFEEFKEPQVDFEKNMKYNMGQLLSLPLFVTGLILVARSFWKKQKSEPLE